MIEVDWTLRLCIKKNPSSWEFGRKCSEEGELSSRREKKLFASWSIVTKDDESRGIYRWGFQTMLQMKITALTDTRRNQTRLSLALKTRFHRRRTNQVTPDEDDLIQCWSSCCWRVPARLSYWQQRPCMKVAEDRGNRLPRTEKSSVKDQPSCGRIHEEVNEL